MRRESPSPRCPESRTAATSSRKPPASGWARSQRGWATAPHGAARSLITSRTNTLGVLLPDLYGEFFSEVIRGIDQTAQRHGHHLLVSSSHDDRSAVETALRSMRGRVDGLIVMWPDLDQNAVPDLPAGFPVVLLSAPIGPNGFDVITVANYDGAFAMVGHLLDLGHRRIAIIKGIEGNADAAERLRGYRGALTSAGLGSAAIEVAGEFNEASGFRATQELLRYPVRPTAIFAANDSMAIGALSALRQAGLRVPEDMALAGFDDIPMARYLDPPLSSVHVDISALGEQATLRLLAALRNKEAHCPRARNLTHHPGHPAFLRRGGSRVATHCAGGRTRYLHHHSPDEAHMRSSFVL